MILEGFGHQMLLGAIVTLKVASASAVLGVILGVAWAAGRLSPHLWVRGPLAGLANLLRGVPEFVILLVFYYGLQTLFNRWSIPIDINPFVGGVGALSVVFAANASEVFRGAFLAVNKGQREAGMAFGMTRRQVFFRIHLPQAWRLALPSLSNLWQNVLKDTSLVSVIGLGDIMYTARIGSNATRQPFSFFIAASLIYLVFWLVSTPLFNALERRAQRGLPR